jgi:WD40 repeat protein
MGALHLVLPGSRSSAPLATPSFSLDAHRPWADTLALSPDGKTLVTSADNDGLLLWRPYEWSRVTGQGKKELCRGQKGTCAAFSPDGKTLATGHEDGVVRLWDLATGTVRASRRLHTVSLRSVACCADGTGLVSVSFDEKAKRFEAKYWDLKEDKDRVVAQGTIAALCASAVSPDGKVLAIAHPVGNNGRDAEHPGQVTLWDVASGKELHRLKGHTAWINRVTFTPDGATLASGGADKTVRLWDVASGKEKATLPGHAGSISGLAISPDGCLLASRGWEGVIKLWDLPAGKERAAFQADPSSAQFSYMNYSWSTLLAYSRDGKTLVSVSGTAKYWDVTKVLGQSGRK